MISVDVNCLYWITFSQTRLNFEEGNKKCKALLDRIQVMVPSND
jgi:hypothetical protein